MQWSNSLSDSPDIKICSRCNNEFHRQPDQAAASWARKRTCGCSKAKETKRPWLSRYGGGEITSAQWLAEVMCERKALAERRKLPLRFWTVEPDASYFKQQLTHANRLLKRFPVAALLSALNDPDLKSCFSLGSAWAVPIFTRYATVLNKPEVKEEEPASELPERPQLTFSPPPSSSGLLGRLRGSHGKKEGS